MIEIRNENNTVLGTVDIKYKGQHSLIIFLEAGDAIFLEWRVLDLPDGNNDYTRDIFIESMNKSLETLRRIPGFKETKNVP